MEEEDDGRAGTEARMKEIRMHKKFMYSEIVRY
jgi:hypothetical protein